MPKSPSREETNVDMPICISKGAVLRDHGLAKAGVDFE
jgi:hypothetical protein